MRKKYYHEHKDKISEKYNVNVEVFIEVMENQDI